MKLLLIILISALVGCAGTQPTKKTIAKAMKYSTWEYKMPSNSIYSNAVYKEKY